MFRAQHKSEYMCRIPELSPDHMAREIVRAVQHNKNTVIVPHNLLFWQNVLKYVNTKRVNSRKYM
jgi:short-subunit dehydrogenase